MNNKEKANFFEAWFSQTSAYYLIMDEDYIIVKANAAMTRFFRRPGDDLSGENLMDLMFCGKKIPCNKCSFHNAVLKAFDKLEPGGHATYSFDHNVGGIDYYYLLKVDCISSSDKKLCLLSMEDVTDLRKSEKEAERLGRMSALGNLSARIAHDLNNICTVILGNVTLSRLVGPVSDNLSDIVSNIKQATLKAADLGQELLTFARGGAPVANLLPLNKLIKRVSAAIGTKHHQLIKTNIVENLWAVSCDEDQIQTAYRNILINAVESIKKIDSEGENEEGTTERALNIEIKASNKVVVVEDFPSLKDGNYVEIQISDKGGGISSDKLNEVFSPFFTTKDKHDGLGLSVAWSIIERHKGRISIYSEVGKGTTITILLPAEDKGFVAVDNDSSAIIKKPDTTAKFAIVEEASVKESDRPDEASAKEPHTKEPHTVKELQTDDSRTFSTLVDTSSDNLYMTSLTDSQKLRKNQDKEHGNILFMDDNKILRLATGEVLKFLGWSVTEAEDGKEALVAYEKALKTENPFDVVVLDLTVPEGMGGMETMRELLKIDPEVKAIVSSGYHFDPIMSSFWEYGFSDCVKKPYMASKLNSAIKKLIDK